MDPKLAAILSNSTAGSVELLSQLNEYLLETIRDIDSLRDTLSLLQNNFKSFSAIRTYLKEVRKFSVKNDFPAFQNYARNLQVDYGSRYKRIETKLYPLLKNVKTIITISNSKTVLEIIKLIGKKKKLKIIVSESRPKEEGKLLAQKLLENGINVRLITEAMIPGWVSKADAAITGADTILSTGNVVNKTGSKMLAITARHFKKPFYIVATRDKISKKGSYRPEMFPAGEIWDYSHPKLIIENPYFEEIDKKLITKIITD